MTGSEITTVQDLAARLPTTVLSRLRKAVGKGPSALRRILADADSSAERHACHQLLDLLAAGVAAAYLAGALDLATAQGTSMQPRPQVVWTGPGDDPHARLTLAVVRDLIAEAQEELLLCTFAAHPSAAIADALAAAATRGVTLTLLLERSADNPHYDGPTDAFPGLPAIRLSWPANHRPPGAALHAKLLVIDRRIAQVGSANLTGRAFLDNLECSVLHRDPRLAGSIIDHLEALVADGILVHVTSDC